LCWIHAERIIRKVHCFTDGQQNILENKSAELWKLYSGLKLYKTEAFESRKDELTKEFDKVFAGNTGFIILDKTLKK